MRLASVEPAVPGFGTIRAGCRRGRPGIGLRPGILRQLTIRSSRTRFVAAPCAFRYASARRRPLSRVGLTQALAGAKSLLKVVRRGIMFLVSSNIRERFSRKRPRHGCGTRLRTRTLFGQRWARGAWLRWDQGMVSAWAPGHRAAARHSAPANNSFKPNLLRGSSRVLALR